MAAAVGGLGAYDRVPPIVWVLLLVPLAVEAGWAPSTAASSFQLSFTKWNGVGPAEPVGLRNYTTMLSDPIFRTALVNNVFWIIAFGGLSVIRGTVARARAEQAPARGGHLPQRDLPADGVLAGGHRPVLPGPRTSRTVRSTSPCSAPSASTPTSTRWLADPVDGPGAILVAAIRRQAGYIMVLYLAGLGRVATPHWRRPQPSTARTSGSGSATSSCRS